MKIDSSIVIESEPGVYEPSEDTYLILRALEVTPSERVLEVGCGTGIIALHCAKAGADVTATDISEAAVRCTGANAKHNSLEVRVFKSDLFENIEASFDLIIFNPPYLPADTPDDPEWTGGATGIELTKDLLHSCGGHLRPGGKVVLILSSLSNIDELKRTASDLSFDMKVVLEKKLFFEALYVIEASKRIIRNHF